MKTNFVLLFLCSLLLVSCSSEQTLQSYFVSHAEDPNFISIDISPSILSVDKSLLSEDEQKALESFDKMNIIAFNLNAENASIYETEKAKVEAILNTEKYNVLMKYNSGMQGVTVSYLGTEEKVDEIIFYARSSDTGFAVVRILGDKITSTDMMYFVSILQKSKINLDQLKPLKNLTDKK